MHFNISQHPNTKYVTQNMPLSPYLHPHSRETSDLSRFRYALCHTRYTIASPCSHVLYCGYATNTLTIYHNNIIATFAAQTHIHHITLTPQPLNTFDLLIPLHVIPHTIYHCITVFSCTVVTPQPYHRNICRPTHTSIIPHTHTPNHSTLSTS